MKHLTDILNESILDDEDTLTKPMDDFIDRPFQSIFNYGSKIKSNRDWEKYLELFINSIKHKCVEIDDSQRGLTPHKLFHKYKKHWVVSIKCLSAKSLPLLTATKSFGTLIEIIAPSSGSSL